MFLLISTLLWANPEEAPQPTSGDASETKEESAPTEESSVETSDEVKKPSEETEDVEIEAVEPVQETISSPQEKTLSDLILLLNESTPIAQRVELLNSLHNAPDVLPALHTLSVYGPIAIRKTMLKLLIEHAEDPITYKIASSALANEDLQEDTYALLSNLKTTQAARILKKRAENKDVSSKERKRARTLLENHYPKFLTKNPTRVLTADPMARAIFSTGSAILGGNVFATLGRLSQGDDGAALGATTGTIAGGVGGSPLWIST